MFTWWAVAAAVPAWALLAALSAAVPGFPVTHVPMTAPVALLLPEGTSVLAGAGDRVAEVRQVSGRLQLTAAPAGEALAFIGLWTAHKVVVLPMLGQLRASSPPSRTAARSRSRTRGSCAGWASPSYLVVAARLVLEVAMAGYAMWAFGDAAVGLWPAVLVSGMALLAGAVLILLAEIHRLGGELEAEQAWTV